MKEYYHMGGMLLCSFQDNATHVLSRETDKSPEF